jgi:hypothetical protein
MALSALPAFVSDNYEVHEWKHAQLLVGNSEVDQDAAQLRDPAKRHLRGHGLTDALVGTDLRPVRRREGQFEELKGDSAPADDPQSSE